ncbi:unnamed protein product [Angiostrongylus costaricensis]|uniref:Uncharacterized protein n=1 Tax=Angiostrongylus costaricensis TaxID=334426 RepID=A0A0R3PNV2_ANGCS|nr:unnamed protein product [Angiostrongylus costaricensis]
MENRLSSGLENERNPALFDSAEHNHRSSDLERKMPPFKTNCHPILSLSLDPESP